MCSDLSLDSILWYRTSAHEHRDRNIYRFFKLEKVGLVPIKVKVIASGQIILHVVAPHSTIDFFSALYRLVVLSSFTSKMNNRCFYFYYTAHLSLSIQLPLIIGIQYFLSGYLFRIILSLFCLEKKNLEVKKNGWQAYLYSFFLWPRSWSCGLVWGNSTGLGWPSGSKRTSYYHSTNL
jgi:hypothetical protein